MTELKVDCVDIEGSGKDLSSSECLQQWYKYYLSLIELEQTRYRSVLGGVCERLSLAIQSQRDSQQDEQIKEIRDQLIELETRLSNKPLIDWIDIGLTLILLIPGGALAGIVGVMLKNTLRPVYSFIVKGSGLSKTILSRAKALDSKIIERLKSNGQLTKIYNEAKLSATKSPKAGASSGGDLIVGTSITDPLKHAITQNLRGSNSNDSSRENRLVKLKNDPYLVAQNTISKIKEKLQSAHDLKSIQVKRRAEAAYDGRLEFEGDLKAFFYFESAVLGTQLGEQKAPKVDSVEVVSVDAYEDAIRLGLILAVTILLFEKSDVFVDNAYTKDTESYTNAIENFESLKTQAEQENNTIPIWPSVDATENAIYNPIDHTRIDGGSHPPKPSRDEREIKFRNWGGISDVFFSFFEEECGDFLTAQGFPYEPSDFLFFALDVIETQ